MTEEDKAETYSPLASSSQISKKTMRSCLEWQGPAGERVRVLSLVAGTATEKTYKMETLSTYKSVHCTEVELSGILRVLQGGKYSKCSDVEESDCGSMNYDDVTMYSTPMAFII